MFQSGTGCESKQRKTPSSIEAYPDCKHLLLLNHEPYHPHVMGRLTYFAPLTIRGYNSI